MTSTAHPRSPRVSVKRRKALMVSCAAAAVAGVLLDPSEAKAQAFQGDITSRSGSVNRTTTSPTSETITIGSRTATINWTATNNNFLPVGHTATFTSTPGRSDYTVLNRVTPADATSPIQLNGSVVSTIQGTTTVGGNIWFYSSSGIVVGSEAVFDVGSLLLTTLDPGTDWTADTSGFSATFTGADGSTAAIQILEGARINALTEGSYVALVAPRIEQGGNVQVNGAAAYVAAEQLTMTMSEGLFDVQVDVGTGDGNGVVHTGTTGGPASTNSASDPHRIYAVAVPKNQALTMLLSGNLGFAAATSASVENGRIILSAGYGVSDEEFDRENTGGATGAANIGIEGRGLTSTAHSLATGTINANISNGTIDLGVSTYGQLGTSSVGLRDSRTGWEAILPGCVCEGWGIAISDSEQWGGANNSTGDDDGTLTLVSHTMTASSVTTVAAVVGTDLVVTHNFIPSESADLYEVEVSITNTGEVTLGDILYRRVMDWDIEPTPFSEYVTLQGVGAETLIGSSDNGFATTNPFGERGERVAGTTDQNFTDSGPADHGALFDFNFGTLEAGETTSFSIYYGASLTEADATTALETVGAEVYSFGQSSDNVDGSTADRSTFIFGFAGVGGTPIGEPPPVEPPPVTPPPGPTPPPLSVDPQTVLGPLGVADDSDDESDAGVTVATSTWLVDTESGVAEGLLDEGVTSGGDTSQWIDDECVPADQRQPGDERPQCAERTE